MGTFVKGWPLLLLAWLLVGCHGGDLPDGGELRVGLAQPPMTLDPRYATDAASTRVQEFLHCGLVRLDNSFLPQPDAAASWRQDDELTWRFRLRDDVFFHDGKTVTAADVAATLDAILAADTASPLRAGFAAIERIEAVSDQELVIRLKQADASLLTRLTLGILPAHLARRPHAARQTLGCGPFRLVSWDDENGLLLERVAGGGGIGRIRLLTVKDPVTRSLKLARGEIDFAQNDLPPHLLPYLHGLEQVEIVSRPSTTFSYIGINLKDAHLADVRVRRALALGLDRAKIKKALLADLPTLAETVLAPGHWAACPVAASRYDPAAAEILLDEAGFPRRQDGMRLHLTYRTSTDPTRLRLAEAMADQWRRIGVDVSIESLEWGGFYARIKQGDFQLFSLSWVGINDPDIYRWILHSSMWPPKGANRGRYANKQVDAWLDAAARTPKREERQELYCRVQRQMAGDQVYIPLWYEPVVAVQGPRLRGFRPAADGSLLGLMHARLRP